MFRVILAALLTAAPGDVAYNAPSNHFDSSEMGSEAIFAGMHICFAQRGGFSPEKIPLCGCLMDAARFNLKRGSPNATPTPEQQRTCEEHTKPKPKAPPKSSKGKAGV